MFLPCHHFFEQSVISDPDRQDGSPSFVQVLEQLLYRLAWKRLVTTSGGIAAVATIQELMIRSAWFLCGVVALSRLV